MPEKPELRFAVKGEDFREAPSALYSNFVAISRVGTDVQFEFLFLDLNVLATMMNAKRVDSAEVGLPEISGKTVAKMVVPAGVVLQLKEHLLGMFQEIEKEMTVAKEVASEFNRTR